MTTILSRQIKRVCLDQSRLLPPTFLLPFTARFSSISVSHTTDSGDAPDTLISSASTNKINVDLSSTQTSTTSSAQASSSAPALPTPAQSPLVLSQNIKDLLPALRVQGPHYITAHIYGRPYLVTAGDSVRLPFLMHGVNPGDILRLNCATSIGSRDFTLKAAAQQPNSRSPTSSTTLVVDPTPGSFFTSYSRVMPGEKPSASLGADQIPVPHFVPHQAKGKITYIDDRLFTCRAVVMGVEAEPMRYKEKTKRRQRRTKTVKSKHRYTILRIQQVEINSVEDAEVLS